MNKKTAFIVLCCLMAHLAGNFSAWGQKNEIDLRDKRITLKMENVYFGTILGYLMETYDIPIGFEQSILDRKDFESRFDPNTPGIAHYPLENVDGIFRMPAKSTFKQPAHPITIYADNERLEDILNKIVKQAENYKWEISDGVVNIYPANGRDDRFEKLLGLKIKRFSFEKGKPIWEIAKNIKALPEFSSFTAENNLRYNGARSGPESALQEQYGRKIGEGMDFSDLTFRQLLNKIVKIKRGGWILKWRFLSKKTGEEYIDIDI